MRNNLCIAIKPLLAALLACAAGAALAQSAADSLAKIEEETLILKAREKQLGVKAQIAAKEAELAAKQVDPNRALPTGEDDVPTVQSIEGIGAKLYATLQLRGGGTVDVSSGAVLPNGMKVVSIRANEVALETPKGRRIRLATSAPETTVPTQLAQRPRLPLPPLPPAMPGTPLPLSNGGLR